MAADDSTDEPARIEGEMRPLHPDQVKVLRFRMSASFTFLLLAALPIDFVALRTAGFPTGILTGPLALLAAICVLLLPGRRYQAWGYREEEDELHIRSGLLVRMRTVVPFGRVQHIDIAQGPIERRYRLATLILHTAGTRAAAVPLPGLLHDDAERMRDRIRAKIRQELV